MGLLFLTVTGDIQQFDEKFPLKLYVFCPVKRMSLLGMDGSVSNWEATIPIFGRKKVHLDLTSVEKRSKCADK
jgi:hypothetical protein